MQVCQEWLRNGLEKAQRHFDARRTLCLASLLNASPFLQQRTFQEDLPKPHKQNSRRTALRALCLMSLNTRETTLQTLTHTNGKKHPVTQPEGHVAQASSLTGSEAVPQSLNTCIQKRLCFYQQNPKPGGTESSL